MASPHKIMSLVWRVAKKNKTQETPIITMKITVVIIIKKQLRDAGAGFNLEDHGVTGSDFSLQ